MTRAIAQLSVRRGPEAIAFYAAAFGAVVDYQVGDDSIVAQLSIGDDATFWVADESPEHANFSPETLGGGTVRMLLIVDDPDAAIARAVAAGATLVSAAEDATAGASGASPTRSATTGRSASRSSRGRRAELALAGGSRRLHVASGPMLTDELGELAHAGADRRLGQRAVAEHQRRRAGRARSRRAC